MAITFEWAPLLFQFYSIYWRFLTCMYIYIYLVNNNNTDEHILFVNYTNMEFCKEDAVVLWP